MTTFGPEQIPVGYDEHRKAKERAERERTASAEYAVRLEDALRRLYLAAERWPLAAGTDKRLAVDELDSALDHVRAVLPSVESDR